MRVAISLNDNSGLGSAVAAHFGRCPFFGVVEVQEGEIQSIEVVENPFYANHQPGQVPGFVNTLNVDVMLTGGMGGRAIQFFAQYDIDAATGASGTAREAVTCYLAGELGGAASCGHVH